MKRLGKPGAIVSELLQPYNNKGHHLYLDNWYSSIELAIYLKEQGTAVCGTIPHNRKGLPKCVVAYQLKKGEFTSRSTDGRLFVKLHGTKEVCFLSTLHDSNVIQTGKRDRHHHPIRNLQLVHD